GQRQSAACVVRDDQALQGAARRILRRIRRADADDEAEAEDRQPAIRARDRGAVPRGVRGVNGPPVDFGIRRLIRLSRDPLGFLTAMRRDYGDFARYRIGPRTIRLASDPELIREVLVTQAAAFHKDRGTEAMKPLLGEGLL